MDFLYWLESIRNPFLDTVMSFFTLFGSEIAFIVIALAIFWCVDKKEGYYLLFVGFFGTILNQFLKLFYRIPRPWEGTSLTVVDGAKADAGGYSFPSGHTQNVTGTLGGIARWSKHWGIRILCIVVLLLTSFSRMYLGVHTPLDVSVSLAISAVLIFVFYPIMKKAADEPRVMSILLAVMVTISFAFVLYANLTDFGTASPENVYEGRKNSFSLFGALLGFCIAYPVERKKINFSEKAPWYVQLLKMVGGLAGLLGIKEGLKLLFNAVGFTWVGTNAVRYFAVVLFAALVWPRVFPYLDRLSKKERTK